MSTTQDYYQVLGVLRNAEQIVITAAYRALASMYHPDKWKGDKDEANQRMAEINVAYSIIGNPAQRASYDQQNQSYTSSMGKEAESVDEAFNSAMSDLESRWKTAVDVLPDLADIRKRLEKTAHRLAFAFVVLMLESKKFQQRKEIASELENRFLEAHFGSNPEIIQFAKTLIDLGAKEAVRALNNYIDVLGSDLDSKFIIKKVQNDFSINEFKSKQKNNSLISELKRDVMVHGYLDSAISLIEASQLIIESDIRGIFGVNTYSVYKTRAENGECILNKVNAGQLINWVKTNLC